MHKNCLYLLSIVFFLTPFVNIFSQNFNDITNSLAISDVNSNNANISRPDLYGTGVSVADYDKDGDLDIFVGTQFGIANQLYQNQGNGVFSEVAGALGISSTYRNRAALWMDYDGDTLLDLILLGDCYRVQGCPEAMSIFVYKQNSSGNFSEVSNSGLNFGTKYNISNFDENIVAGGMASADINNDGFLDLLITVWGTNGIGAELTLFKNNGDGTFTDISQVSNLGGISQSRWQPLFHDFNKDGYLDIYINLDFAPNELWLNNTDETFSNVASTYNADNAFNEMGLAAGDYDNDGDIDVYSTNITRVETGEIDTRHNILLKNDTNSGGNLSFSEVAKDLNIDASDWDWGTTFFDANNDGFLDLAATNGWVERANWPLGPSKFWLSVDGLTFTDQSAVSGFNDNLDATTLIAFDLERDGDLDLVQSIKQVSGDFKPIRIYENDYSANTNPNNYLVVKPRMNGNNHFAIGAVVKITYNVGTIGTRLITAGTSFYGQEPAEAFFGLGDNTIVDEIRIEWPDNTITVVNNITANQVIVITNDTILSTSDESEIETIKIYPNPLKNSLNIKSKHTVKEIKIYNLLGQEIKSFKSEVKIESIDISELETGQYFVKLKSSNNQEIKKIVKL